MATVWHTYDRQPMENMDTIATLSGTPAYTQEQMRKLWAPAKMMRWIPNREGLTLSYAVAQSVSLNDDATTLHLMRCDEAMLFLSDTQKQMDFTMSNAKAIPSLQDYETWMACQKDSRGTAHILAHCHADRPQMVNESTSTARASP
jgi:hypothetical protein